MLFIVGKIDGFDAWRIVTDDGRQKVVSTVEIEKHMRTGNLKIENAVLGKIDKKMRGYFCDLEKLISNSGDVTYIKDDIFIKSNGELVPGKQVMSQRIVGRVYGDLCVAELYDVYLCIKKYKRKKRFNRGGDYV